MSVGQASGKVLRVDAVRNEFERGGRREVRDYKVAMVLNGDDVQRVVLHEKSDVKAGDDVSMAVRPGTRWVGNRTIPCFFEVV